MIYFVQHPEDGLIKIGYTGNFLIRFSQLCKEYNAKLKPIGFCDGDLQKEQELHKQFAVCWRFGEWFKPSPELLEWIKNNTSNRVPAIQRVRRSSTLTPVIYRKTIKRIPFHWCDPEKIARLVESIEQAHGGVQARKALAEFLHFHWRHKDALTKHFSHYFEETED